MVGLLTRNPTFKGLNPAATAAGERKLEEIEVGEKILPDDHDFYKGSFDSSSDACNG